MDPAFAAIAKLLQKLPGIGPRASSRMVLALLDRPQEELSELGDAIRELKQRIRICPQCCNVADNDICAICRDNRRDPQTIMIVENITDLQSVERAGLWKGLYHVLGGSISPVNGIGPERLRIRELAERVDRIVQDAGAVELVLATNPTSSGEMTALYIRDLFQKLPGVRTTRLARGLSTGTHLEYADEITLRHALESRK